MSLSTACIGYGDLGAIDPLAGVNVASGTGLGTIQVSFQLSSDQPVSYLIVKAAYNGGVPTCLGEGFAAYQAYPSPTMTGYYSFTVKRESFTQLSASFVACAYDTYSQLSLEQPLGQVFFNLGTPFAVSILDVAQADGEAPVVTLVMGGDQLIAGYKSISFRLVARETEYEGDIFNYDCSSGFDMGTIEAPSGGFVPRQNIDYQLNSSELAEYLTSSDNLENDVLLTCVYDVTGQVAVSYFVFQSTKTSMSPIEVLGGGGSTMTN
jgi:hypothetical protein